MVPTTACYFGSLHLEGTMKLVKYVVEHKQRALVGKVSMNVENDVGYYNKTDKELQEVEQFIKRVLSYKNELVQPIITPRFAVSCSNELMCGLSKTSGRDTNVAFRIKFYTKLYEYKQKSHIGKQKKEIEYVLETNPECASYTEVYQRCGIFNSPCIMAHAVHLTEDEMSEFNVRQVSVAHCPASNTRLNSGLCPVRKLLDRGIRVGLGTDISGGDNASMLDAMRRAMDVSLHLAMMGQPHTTLDWKEAFYLATLGGARALRLEDKIGSFDIGKQFDALLIDVYAMGGPIDKYDYNSGEDQLVELVQRFVYLGDDRNIRQVYVNGETIKKF
ncbi:unnamed protein product [Danaus chrysippus]|uniref:(African queen) hypothetical protein n=1 Tax=Danaus chrysippus TaxID=151541 RepID=A0A8J2QS59_9NEOP|nr:unnamed protein product [Danaus chrysippus]